MRWPTLSNRILSIDEPDYFAQAARLRSVEAFIYSFYYRVEVKSQIGLIPYLLAAAIDPPNAVFLVHVFGLLAVLASCWLLIAMAARFLGGPLPGLAAALLWLPYLEVGPGYALGGHNVLEYFPAPKLEYFQTPFVLATIYLFADGAQALARDQRRAARLLAGAGVLWAVAVLIKPSALLLGPFYLAALPFIVPRAAWGRQLLGAGAAFVVAAAVPVVLVFGPYLLNPPALAELRFNLFESTSSYAAAGATEPTIRILSLLLTGLPPLLGLGFLLGPFAVRSALRGRPAPAASPLLPLVIGSGPLLFLSSLAGCICPYYYVTIVPFLALTVTAYLAQLGTVLLQAGRRREAIAGAALLAVLYLAPQLPALAAFPAQAGTDLYLADDRARFDLDGVLGYIREHAPPDAPIWVYYNTPELYMWSDRPPATRDPQADWLSFVWSEPWFSRTVAELAAEQPAVIVGIDQARLPHPNARSITEIPQVSAWIAAHYQCNPALVRGTTVCTRNP
ncbi:MAG TPA: hypothetical protein VM536_19180 [Chloroflexia bacterium]|nr:hypothetical protein [Chloroflexia bacterium]